MKYLFCSPFLLSYYTLLFCLDKLANSFKINGGSCSRPADHSTTLGKRYYTMVYPTLSKVRTLLNPCLVHTFNCILILWLMVLMRSSLFWAQPNKIDCQSCKMEPQGGPLITDWAIQPARKCLIGVGVCLEGRCLDGAFKTSVSRECLEILGQDNVFYLNPILLDLIFFGPKICGNPIFLVLTI